MVRGIDRSTGAELWRWRASAYPSLGFHGIARLVVEQRHVIVFAGSLVPPQRARQQEPDYRGSVSCLDTRTGTLHWEHRLELGPWKEGFGVTLLIDAGQVVVGYPTQVLAYALEDGTPQWRHELDDAAHALPLVALALPGLVAPSGTRE